MTRFTIPLVVLLGALPTGCEDEPKPKQNAGCNTNAAEEASLSRPRIPGKLKLTLRDRHAAKDEKPVAARERVVEWPAAETAIIICDMWDDLYCKSAAQRIGVMVPRMNETITHARSNGVLVVHAPSGTMDLYADTPHRKRVQRAKPAKPPTPLEAWCHVDPKREPDLPVETEKCACDDPVVGAFVRKFSRQHPGLDIVGYDGISDSGPEIYNFLVQEGIKNVAVMGVHTNLCVLGRPFGIRQLVKVGFNVVLVRDLTDAMYDPRQPPFVSHARGTELVVEHIERYWCPSILAADLTRAVP
jgi:nicotinamidase-related amidase